MQKLLLMVLVVFGWQAALNAQTHTLKGEVADQEGTPLIYASVVLLNPADSTLQYFGITNTKGFFEIKNIRQNSYLMQISYLGCQTFYHEMKVPGPAGSDLGTILLKPSPVAIDEVMVTGGRIPLSINKDTIEFNAAAFQLKSGAVTEDLLKKLPGIEIDRAGNIKAMGEDVSRVFVDGKEFFGNDPKVATKNIPASAVDKVQVYDRKSENAMFTGINDGLREKAINLKLQEESKQAVFGTLLAGGGTGETYQGSARVYRFDDKIQLAGLGMLNNVNQTGFSMDDYINFSGGAVRMLSGGGSAQIRITNDGSFPVNFGTPVSGLTTSGAGGLNFSRSNGPNNRAFISYLGNGSEKELEQTTKSTNFLQEKSYDQSEELNEVQRNDAHRFNFGIRNRIDTLQNINLNGNFSLTTGKGSRELTSSSSENKLPVNLLESWSDSRSGRMTGDAAASYIRKIRSNRTIWEVSGNGSFASGDDDTRFENVTAYYNNGNNQVTSQFQNNRNSSVTWGVSTSLTQRIGKQLYLEPSVRLGGNFEMLDRELGLPLLNDQPIDSLSARFDKKYTFARPGLNLSLNLERVRFSVTLAAETGQMSNQLRNSALNDPSYFYLLPSLSYENEYRTGKRIMFNYSSSVTTPAVSQLFPVANTLNPLVIVKGNPDLKPEYAHRASFHWVYFDQFSFTSLFTALNASVIKDKISWERNINERLQQVNSYFNGDRDFSAGGNVSFSTPIRSIGVQLSINAEERYSKGLSRINGTDNISTNWSHRASFSGGNRKKEKVDLNAGLEVTFTRTGYSVQKALNNDYFDISGFADLRYTPNKKWDFEANADITRYTVKSFGEPVNIPLIGGEVSRHFLQNERATLTLRAFDLLNQNKTVQRFGEINYLREVRSNSIGHFVMLTFSYRLNRFGSSPGGVHVEMRRR